MFLLFLIVLVSFEMPLQGEQGVHELSEALSLILLNDGPTQKVVLCTVHAIFPVKLYALYLPKFESPQSQTVHCLSFPRLLRGVSLRRPLQ